MFIIRLEFGQLELSLTELPFSLLHNPFYF